ncbi:hypothetical protein EST38_g7185 [Candolleomyces aberdarensis]|uniref:Uncharacterized protein n=1 Tax=Candolleomyces aberdarensis TaxID=2316362 RepID=A0A4V1Q3I1_9AGAR|nr:hypothetical protein EST38_g7185 [Candolleomyces aberdarensis]
MLSSTQPQWRPISPSNGDGPAFERPLGITEEGFYWDSVFNRTADILRHAEVLVQGDSVLSATSMVKTWAALKQRYPLLQATIEERSPDDVVFVVDPSRSFPDNQPDLFFEEAHTPEEVDRRVYSLLNGQSPLSNTLLACVVVVKRTDNPGHAHILIHSAHSISDGIANNTLLRELLQLLADPSAIAPVPWTERLALAVATETLPPYQDNSLPKTRWRRAIGRTIMENRRARMIGGHTLPRAVTSKTIYTPAESCAAFLSFTVQETKQILQTCRDNQLTFGSVLPMVGQLAMGRVLCSRYLKGQISAAEWEFRKTEPMVNAGPLNLRPRVDSDWYQSGGAGNVSLSIGFYFYQLPAAPLGSAAGKLPGDSMPTHFDMLPKSHFFHRCPYLPPRLIRLKGVSIHWRNNQDEELEEAELLTPQEEASASFVFNHGGATLGNLDKVLPWEYRSSDKDHLAGSQQATAIELLQVRSFLHCRPTELYLGASTFRERLKFHIFWDGHVYDTEVVHQWLAELMEATRAYLCNGSIGARS